MSKEQNWDLVIKPKAKLLSLKLREIWQYRDLIVLFVKRDLTATYKQNLLGPLWFFIQPIFTIITYYVMFGRIAQIPTGDKPILLFYLGGLVMWNYFADCLNSTSNVFVSNAGLFGKVYFPRLIAPLSTIISTLFKFSIQFVLFILLWMYYWYFRPEYNLHLSTAVFIIPLLVILVALLGLGFGMLLSSITTKYRDLRNVIGYALQFALYATPIIYPLGWMKVKLPFFYQVCIINPMTSVVETFKYIFLGDASFSPQMLLYSFAFAVVLFVIALALFNKTEKTFVDTV